MGSERVNLAVNWSEKCRGRRGRKNGGWWRARTGGSKRLSFLCDGSEGVSTLALKSIFQSHNVA